MRMHSSVYSLLSVDFAETGCSTNRSSPLGFDSEWNCADRGVELPSSQNSTLPSALSEPFLTRLPFSRIRSSMVTDLSEKIYSSQWSCSYYAWEVTCLQMVADQMPVFTLRASDQHRPLVVALLRQAMRGARLADIAREGQFV